MYCPSFLHPSHYLIQRIKLQIRYSDARLKPCMGGGRNLGINGRAVLSSFQEKLLLPRTIASI